MIKVATYIARTYVEGPGVRYAIWLHNSSDHIPSDEQDQDQDQALRPLLEVSPEALAREVTQEKVVGVTLLGGEPFKQALVLADFARLIQESGLTVMIYSAFGLGHLRSLALEDRGVRSLLAHTDLLITGSLAQWNPEQTRRWVGSVNQQIHFLSDAHDPKNHQYAVRYDAPHQREVRLQYNDTDHLKTLTNGWPHHDPEEDQLGASLRVKVSQVLGLQWLDDLFLRETFTIDLTQEWTCDHAYWSIALDRSRKRCAWWMLEMSRSAVLPRLVDDRLVEVNALDIDPKNHPLRFGPVTEALLGGPKTWRTSLKKTWSLNKSKSERVSPRWIHSDHHAPIYLGDWLLLGSFWTKLTRHKVTAHVCQSLMSRPRKEHHKVKTWLIHTSPICALLDLSEGASLLIGYPKEKLPQQFSHFISLVSTGLARWWVAQVRRERLPDELFTGDGWRLLASLASLNQWAAEMGYFPLGEACISTVSQALSEIDPESFFSMTAPSMDQLHTERTQRHHLCQIHQPWRLLIDRAHQATFGDEDYLHAQLTLRYATRWRDYFSSLRAIDLYGDRLLSSGAERVVDR